MGLELCKSCGRMHYSTDPCKESTEASARSVEDMVRPLRYNATRDDKPRSVDITPAQAANPLERAIPQEPVASTTNAKSAARSNTPQPKRDRNDYHAKYQREVYRPRKKAEKAKGVNA